MRGVLKSTGAIDRLHSRMKAIISKHSVSKFVFVCGTFRSGSTLFATLLHINGLGDPRLERFNLFESAWLHQLSEEERLAAFDNIIETGTIKGVFASKLMWNHKNCFFNAFSLTGENFKTLGSMFPELTFFYVTRRDKIAQAVSFWRAKQTDIWHKYRNNTESGVPPYSFTEILACANEQAMSDFFWERFFQEIQADVFHVEYLDIERNPGDTIRSALAFDRRVDLSEVDPLTLNLNVDLIKQRDGHSELYIQRFVEDSFQLGTGLLEQ